MKINFPVLHDVLNVLFPKSNIITAYTSKNYRNLRRELQKIGSLPNKQYNQLFAHQSELQIKCITFNSIDSTSITSSPNPLFNHLLESSHRDDSNKWSNIVFCEEITQVESIEVHFTHLIWSFVRILLISKSIHS